MIMVTNNLKNRINEDFGKRLNLLLDETGFPPKYNGRVVLLGKKYGVSHKAAANWLDGISIPKRLILTDMAKDMGVTEAFLEYGKYPKYSSEVTGQPAPSKKEIYDLIDSLPKSKESLAKAMLKALIDDND